MTNNHFSREELLSIIETDHLQYGEASMLARMALAAMDSEPVAWTWHYREQWHVTNDKCRAEFVATDGDVAVLPLYRHAQQVPVAPVCTCPSGNGSLRWPCPVHPGNSPANPGCWFRTCRPVVLNDMRFVVCPDCGNKRCPRANDHRNACTGSNDPGQEGSAYPDTPQEVKGE
ncbi:TPA: hypothetical protein UN082_001899 [Klebsiella pneumoniae]|nr:hypothetical protein [Klebsiella pneumoniae]